MVWQLFDSGCATAEENMELDQRLLNEIQPHTPPLLHLYDWKAPSATYGYFTNPADFLSLQAIHSQGLTLARRPTGGGIIFHLYDFAFSLIMPITYSEVTLNTLDNYHFVNGYVAKAIQLFSGGTLTTQLLPTEMPSLDSSSQHFCMAKPTKYDIIVEGRKVGGGAQRRTKQGLLHQGSISLRMPSKELLNEVLLPGTLVLESMQQQSYPLLGASASAKELGEARSELKKLLFASLNG